MNRSGIYMAVIVVLFGSAFLLSGCEEINAAAEEKAIESARAMQEENPELIYFRNVVWGMTMDEVAEVEKEPLLRDENVLSVTDAADIYGHDGVTMAYSFNYDGELYNGAYLIKELYSDKDQHIAD